MKYLVRVVWMLENGEIQSMIKKTDYHVIAEGFFNNYCTLMEKSPYLGIKRVSLYEDGYEIERRIKENGSQIRN